MRRAIVSISCLCFSFYFLLGQTPRGSYIIREVKIQAENVFPLDAEGYKGLMNSTHMLTRERVLERELLFQANDSLDFELIEESERNLRHLQFLEKVEIRIDTISADSVDVYVHTSDQWSLVPSVIIEAGGGLIGLGASLEESNFLGLGKSLYLDFFNESDVGTSYLFSYDDYQTFGTRWKTKASFETGPLEKSLDLSFERPFYASDVAWSYSIDYYASDEKVRFFLEGEEFSRIQEISQGLFLESAYSFGERYRKRKVFLKYRYEDKNFTDLGELTHTPLPEDYLVSATTVEFKIGHNKYTKETQIDNFERVEDIRLGYSTSLSVGKAGFPVAVGKDWFEFGFYNYYSTKIKQRNYLELLASYNSQEVQNTIYRFRSNFYSKLNSWQTLAFNFSFKYAVDLEYSRQFLLGGDSGLRGYKAREFGGDKYFLINLEDRLFSGLEVLTMHVGGVVFVDAGHVWHRDEEIDLKQLNYSAGFGLRLGYARVSGAPVVRLDLGFPINGKGGYGFSFGIDQQF